MTNMTPAVGVDFDPFAAEYLVDPYPTLASLRARAPVHYSPALDHWLVTRYADVEAILRDPDWFSAANAQDPIFPLHDAARAVLAEGFRPIRTMSNLDGHEHTRIRRHNQVGFGPRRLRGLEPVVRATAATCLADLAAHGPPGDFVRWVAFPLPATIIFALLGFPPEDTERLKSFCGNRMAFSWGHPTVAEQTAIATNMVAYWQYCEAHIERRLADPADDFTSDLLSIHRSDATALSLHEVTHVVYGLSFAGHETTTNLLANTLRRALETPGVWAALGADRSLVAGAVDEGLRHDTSVLTWRRVTTEAVVIGGVAVPAGARLLLALGGANRDPDVFVDPDSFDPVRPDARRHLSFGFGKHYCLGATLAKVEVTVVLEALLDQFDDLALVPDQELTFDPNVAFRGPAHLELTWTRA